MKLREQLEKIDSCLEDLRIITIKQQAILEEHMRRTDLLEKQLAPITKLYNFGQVAMVLVGILASLAAVISLFL